jgi:hypothetical protein
MKKIRKLAALCAVLVLLLSFTTVAYAYSGEDSAEETTDIVTGGISDTEDTTVFTPDGTGTVVDNATDEDGKEFYTIITPDENVFYLVIDRQRETENVYFLDAVTEKDLLALAKQADGDTEESGVDSAVTSTAEPETTREVTATPEASEDTTEQTATETQDNNMGTLLLVLAVVLIGGGAGYYFKIYRPKHRGTESEDDFDYGDESNFDDTEDVEQDDGLPLWEDTDGGDDEA